MSLAQRNACLDVRSEADVADLHRLNPDPAQDEFFLDLLADAHVEDFSVAGKCSYRVVRRTERADVVIRKLWWLRRWRRLRLGWRLRLRRRLRDGLGRRRRRGRGGLLVCEEIPRAPVAAALALEILGMDDAHSRSDGRHHALRRRVLQRTRLRLGDSDPRALRRRKGINGKEGDDDQPHDGPGLPAHPIHHISLLTIVLRDGSRNTVFSRRFSVRLESAPPPVARLMASMITN